MSEKIVIIGGGQAGGMVSVYLRQMKFSGEITIVTEENYFPYQRPALSKGFLSGEIGEERLMLKTENYYRGNNIEVLRNSHVTEIDRINKTIRIEEGIKNISYDKLVIATGSTLNKLKLHKENNNVHYIRTINDANSIKDKLQSGKKIIIVGGGYIGLELASIAIKKKLEVMIIEAGDYLMSRTTSRQMSEFFSDKHKSMGVKINFNQSVQNIEDKSSIVICDDNARLKSDIVFAGIGIRPNIMLAENAGLKCDNGILVDGNGKTSDEDIFAVGDCTNHPNRIYKQRLRLESVHNAVEQSKSVAYNILGRQQTYNQVPWFWSDQYNLKLQVAGIFNKYENLVISGSKEKECFSLSFFKKNKLICVEAVNRPKDFMLGRKIIASGKQFDSKLIESGVADLSAFKK
tara:strand:- start:373 stop:1584 length:1212 start_codon:yes stop_codon:yes gene_type:complete